jgi:predicted ester cyclase
MAPALAAAAIRARLSWPPDAVEHRRIRRLWQQHSIAEDRRDIDGLLATLTPDCVYEIVGAGLRWEGHDGARAFYTALFAAFPDNVFRLTDIVIGPQGVFEAATLEATHRGPFAGLAPSGDRVRLAVAIHFPWVPEADRFAGERIFLDRTALAGRRRLAGNRRMAASGGATGSRGSSRR